MKRLFLLFVLLIFVVSPVFSANFLPTQMKLSAPGIVPYDFDGSTVNIPLTASGTPGAGFFVINTKDQAEKIGVVQNGHLGWHYVNGIDTAVYVSPLTQFGIGSNTLTWNGKDSDGGGIVPAGEYTYYVWAYDYFSSKTVISRPMTGWTAWNRITLITHDTDGTPLSNPPIYLGTQRHLYSGVIDSEGKVTVVPGINKKWIIGNDPSDASLLETCQTNDWATAGGLEFHPRDHSMFFLDSMFDYVTKITRKWKWVPNGDAVLQTDWGEEGAFIYSSNNGSGWSQYLDVTSDGKDYLIVGDGDYSGKNTQVRLFYVDVNDGTEIKRFDMSEWWVRPEDGEKGGQASSGPQNLELRHDRMLVSGFCTCVNMMIDPYYEDDVDAILWVNQNGDYVNDKNFAEDSTKPWLCNDYNVAPWKYVSSMDANLFNGNTVYALGSTSFAMLAPDGTGLATLAVAGETSGAKYGFKFIDYGSPYDGLMLDNQTTAGTEEDKAGIWWLGSDSVKGIITSNPVAVEENALTAFSVSQNSPNPFNPTTTINFSIPEAGNVSVAVYNVAGQRVATIADGLMSAGSHSVAWDASGFSAGMYFYTVKSGEYSKTMKMTLLK